ncbi:MAG: hypothetical protein OER95_15395 [Acidimicrobiia bacterium]|nr:hypothetical protein [Acidimicrobiia bacterium]
MAGSPTSGRRRLYAAVLFLGGGVLMVRAVTLLGQDAPSRWVPWVGIALYVETAAIIVALVALVRWFLIPDDHHTTTAFWATAALVFVHAFRVAVFALGRTGPWVDFDVRPEYRADHGDSWTWGEVYFASGAALLSVIITLVVWRRRSDHGGSVRGSGLGAGGPYRQRNG